MRGPALGVALIRLRSAKDAAQSATNRADNPKPVAGQPATTDPSTGSAKRQDCAGFAARNQERTTAPGAHGAWSMIRSLTRFAAGILVLWALLGWCVWQWVQSQPDLEDDGRPKLTINESDGRVLVKEEGVSR